MVPYSLRSEMGEAIANALLGQGHKGKTNTITANRGYSYKDVVDIPYKISGRKIALFDPLLANSRFPSRQLSHRISGAKV